MPDQTKTAAKSEPLTDEKKQENLQTELNNISKTIKETIGHSYSPTSNRVTHKYLNRYEEQESARKLKDIASKAVEEFDDKFIREEKTHGPILNDVQKIFRDLDAKLNNQFSDLVETGETFDFQARIKYVNDAQQTLAAKCDELAELYRAEFKKSDAYKAALGGIAEAEKKKENDLKDDQKDDSPGAIKFRLESELVAKENRIKALALELKNVEEKVTAAEAKSGGPVGDPLKKELADAKDALHIAYAAEHKSKAELDKFTKSLDAGIEAAKAKLDNLEQSEVSSKISELEKFKKAKIDELEHFKKAGEFQKEVNKFKQSIEDQHHIALADAYRRNREITDSNRWILVAGEAFEAKKAADEQLSIGGGKPDETVAPPGTYAKVGWGWKVVFHKDGTVTTDPLPDEGQDLTGNYLARLDFLAETGCKQMFIKYKNLNRMSIEMTKTLCQEAWKRGMTVDLSDIMNKIGTANPPLTQYIVNELNNLKNENELRKKNQSSEDKMVEESAKDFKVDAQLHNKAKLLESNKANRISENTGLNHDDLVELEIPPVLSADAKDIAQGKLYVYESKLGGDAMLCYKTSSGEVKPVKVSDLDELKSKLAVPTPPQKWIPLSDENREIIVNSKFFEDLSSSKKQDTYLSSVEAKATSSADKLKSYKTEIDKLTSQAGRLGEGIRALEATIGDIADTMSKIEKGEDPYKNPAKANEEIDKLKTKYDKLQNKMESLREETKAELVDVQTKREALEKGLSKLKFNKDEPKFNSKLTSLKEALKPEMFLKEEFMQGKLGKVEAGVVIDQAKPLNAAESRLSQLSENLKHFEDNYEALKDSISRRSVSP